MKYIEMKTERYIYRYDFEPINSTDEAFVPSLVIPVENPSDVDTALNICLDLLRCCFSKEAVKAAIEELDKA